MKILGVIVIVFGIPWAVISLIAWGVGASPIHAYIIGWVAVHVELLALCIAGYRMKRAV